MANISDYEEYDGYFLYQMWHALKQRALREQATKNITPIGKLILGLLEKESNIHQTMQSGKSAEAGSQSVAKQKDTLKMVPTKERSAKKSPDKKTDIISRPSITLDKKLELIDAIIREYDACQDQEKMGKGLWRLIIQKVVIKLSNWQFEKAYSYWSRWKISALTHEKGKSDILDNKIWNLLKRHEVFKNGHTSNRSIHASPESKKPCNFHTSADFDQKATIEHCKEQIAPLPICSNESKKRLSEEITISGKKHKNSSNYVSEEEGLALVKILKKTCGEMCKKKPSSVHWSTVTKNIFENGGYKDLTLEEVDALWYRMIVNASRNKYNRNVTTLDKEVLNLVTEASNNQISNRDLLSIQEVKNLQKTDHIPRLVKGLKPSFDNLESPSLSKEQPDIESNKVKINWTSEETLALVSAIMNYGDAVFKVNKEDSTWPEIFKKFQDAGYSRSILATKSRWYYIRKHAEKTWANKTARNEVDKILIPFMTKFSKFDTNGASHISESNITDDRLENSEEKDEVGSVPCVDLTYDYVSFADIEKLSAETMEESIIKTEFIKKNAKVEGGIQFDEGCAQYDKEICHLQRPGVSSLKKEKEEGSNIEERKSFSVERNIPVPPFLDKINDLHNSIVAQNEELNEIIELSDSEG